MYVCVCVYIYIYYSFIHLFKELLCSFFLTLFSLFLSPFIYLFNDTYTLNSFLLILLSVSKITFPYLLPSHQLKRKLEKVKGQRIKVGFTVN